MERINIISNPLHLEEFPTSIMHLLEREGNRRIKNLWASNSIEIYLWRYNRILLGLRIFSRNISWMMDGGATVPCLLRARRKNIISKVTSAWGWKVGKPWPWTFVSKTVIIRLISQTTWTEQKVAELPIEECPIWRPSSKCVNLLTISSIFILKIIRWALGVWMIGVRSSQFIFIASQTLSKRKCKLPLGWLHATTYIYP